MYTYLCSCTYMYIHVHDFMKLSEHVHTCLYHVQTRMYRFANSCPGGQDSRCGEPAVSAYSEYFESHILHILHIVLHIVFPILFCIFCICFNLPGPARRRQACSSGQYVSELECILFNLKFYCIILNLLSSGRRQKQKATISKLEVGSAYILPICRI